MKIIYDKKVDDNCWKRLENTDLIFGEKKRTTRNNVDNKILNYFNQQWTKEIELKYKDGFKKIFNLEFPDEFMIYVNSSSYSMDLEDGISISASTETLIRTICHETSHFLFRRSDFANIYFPEKDIEEAKEIFTIINNIYFRDIMENQDTGWKKFWKERYEFLTRWIPDHQELM